MKVLFCFPKQKYNIIITELDRTFNVINKTNNYSIKKKVKGGNQGGGAKTLPSSNSSPVHSVQPPPHSGLKTVGPRPSNGVENSEPISSAIVKYNYQAQQLDELSLVKGSRVMILEKSGDGWWRGQYGNKVSSCYCW